MKFFSIRYSGHHQAAAKRQNVLFPSPIPKNSSGVTLGSVQATALSTLSIPSQNHKASNQRDVPTITVPCSTSLPFFCISENLIGVLYPSLSAHSLLSTRQSAFIHTSKAKGEICRDMYLPVLSEIFSNSRIRDLWRHGLVIFKTTCLEQDKTTGRK
jgi:hypothetical protein